MKHSTGIAVVVIALFLSFSVSYSQNTAEESWLKGVELGAQGKFTEAKKEFEKAMKADPFYTFAESGLKTIEDIVGKKIKEESAIHLFKGAMYGHKKEWDKTIAEFNKAIELDPKYAMAYNDRGGTYHKKGQHDKAIADFNKVIELNPRHAMAYYNRGNIYLNKGQDDKAIVDYSKAIDINPELAVAYNNRAISYYYIKEYSWAWDDVYKAQILGYQVPHGFIEDLRKASGRQK